MRTWRIVNILNFPILQVDYSPDNFLIEYRHLPHKTLTQNLPSHEKWSRLRAKNEIGQISSETENVVILLWFQKVKCWSIAQLHPTIENFLTLDFWKEESPHFWFRSLFDRSHFLLLILLIFREKIGFGSKFRVGSVYILLESYLDNNQPVKWEKSKRSKYTNFSW